MPVDSWAFQADSPEGEELGLAVDAPFFGGGVVGGGGYPEDQPHG